MIAIVSSEHTEQTQQNARQHLLRRLLSSCFRDLLPLMRLANLPNVMVTVVDAPELLELLLVEAVVDAVTLRLPLLLPPPEELVVDFGKVLALGFDG